MGESGRGFGLLAGLLQEHVFHQPISLQHTLRSVRIHQETYKQNQALRSSTAALVLSVSRLVPQLGEGGQS